MTEARSKSLKFAAFCVVSLLASAPSQASAAGLYFSDRGVRPLGRGGAFVAGADDLGAIYYNPAGIVEAGSQVLLDASWLHFSSEFTRTALVTSTDPNTGAAGAQYLQQFDTVKGTTPVLPIPTLAGSYALSKDLVVAAGVYAPYAALTTYPDTVNGKPAPQRYSLLSLNGSALAIAGVYVGWRPIKQLEIGAGPNILLGNFSSTVTLGACVPDRFVCAPEQPDYDAKGSLAVHGIAAPSGTLGAIVTPIDELRIGASFQLPYSIDSHAQFQTKLPSAAVFQNATITGEDAEVKFMLPWILRFGVEARPLPKTRIEAAFVYEAWHVHDKIDVTPTDTVLHNVALFPAEYHVAPLSIVRGFQDAWSIRLGGEHTFHLGNYDLDARAGFAYETSAVPPKYLSVLTVDMAKVTASIGGGLHIGTHWRFDGVLAFLFPTSVDVSTSEASLYKLNPVRANRPPGGDIPINAGKYSASANVLGVGIVYTFDPPAASVPTEASTPPEDKKSRLKHVDEE